MLTALDHRAATFEKLNQLQSALKDAKEMIELNPGLAKVCSLCSICTESMECRELSGGDSYPVMLRAHIKSSEHLCQVLGWKCQLNHPRDS
jgi:hypothetical protein